MPGAWLVVGVGSGRKPFLAFLDWEGRRKETGMLGLAGSPPLRGQLLVSVEEAEGAHTAVPHQSTQEGQLPPNINSF